MQNTRDYQFVTLAPLLQTQLPLTVQSALHCLHNSETLITLARPTSSRTSLAVQKSMWKNRTQR